MKKFTINLLNNAKGDDLYRAKSAFKNCTKEELNTEYGESGKTRQEIIDEYQAYEDKIGKAIEWVKEK